MATSGPESSQWLSVTEGTLFLHDGLLRVTDLVELPKNVECCGSRENEVVTFDSKDPEELSAKLLEICGTRNNAFNTLLEYRLNALKGLWKAQKLYFQEDPGERDSASQDEAIAILKKQGLLKDSDQASFSTRISLLLILPLLQSQSNTDPDLCGVTSGVILTCLRDCPPLSLAKEPSDCLNGLESLLCGWLGEKSLNTPAVHIVKEKKHQENAASALVALACARGHVKTLIHTVHLLQQLSTLPPLPVADILAALLECEGGQGQITSFLGSKYIVSWGLDDLLGPTNADTVASESKESNDKDKDKEQDLGRSITTDGCYLYTTNSFGKGIAKVGTGLQGTLRGFIYNKNTEPGPGRLAFGSGLLLFRPQKFDAESEVDNLIQIYDRDKLEALKVVSKPSVFVQPGPCTTVGFCSDGVYFYWMWCPTLLQDKSTKNVNVNLSAFYMEKEAEATALRPSVTLQKKEEAVSRNMNEAILNRLRPLRGSNSAATLMALTGGEALVPTRKEDAPSAGSTSCGVQLKTLAKTPLYCDGNHVVLLTVPPGAAPGGAGRSLFGGGPISSIRSLASNMCFNVKTGFFSARMDLMEASSSSVGRGTPLTLLGACFDIVNNMLWMSSGEYVDQFFNPGNLPPHHVYSRLGIQDTSPPFNLTDKHQLPVKVVVNTLLHNVGSMCLHQMTVDSPPSSQPEQTVDLSHLTRVTDILARAVLDKDEQAVLCCLVVLQLIFKTSTAVSGDQPTSEQMKVTRSLIWKLLSTSCLPEGQLDLSMKREACHVITIGLRSLYPSTEDRHILLYQLLTSGDESPALRQLRDMILTEFSLQLNSLQPSAKEEEVLQLSDDLVWYILKLAVKESCTLLNHARSWSKLNFQKTISNMPLASPAVLYLSALRSYYLRSAVLYDTSHTTSSGDLLPLEAIQAKVLALSSKLITGACEVLESFLDTCNIVLAASQTEELEAWLAGLERLAKSTILGSLMPVLITALTHPNLQSLSLAGALMPSLVTLSLLASQAALKMKSQELAASASLTANSDLDLDSDKEMAEFIGEALHRDDAGMSMEEEEGFLTGLKIPTPWASGKTVETIHPVRDNYKFKETIHIPGARCLYLRFDSRCSSQYDYDKVVVYAGAGINGKKVVEYGGNSFGYGSRSVLGSGWPKDLVKVDGDTVTLTFEMRSGREHNTPDKAMWGFACTIRAQESAEEVTPGLPFLSDLALGLSVLLCTQLAQLYHGSPASQDEADCQHLLKSRILQRCIWKTERCADGVERSSEASSAALASPPRADEPELSGALMSARLPRIKLSSDIMDRLRRLIKRQPVRLRASIKSAIEMEVVEESIISAVAKHLGLTDSLRDLRTVVDKQGDELAALMAILEETYRRFEVLIRQLQLMGELEKRWETEVEERALGPGSKCVGLEELTVSSPSNDPPFFHDYHLQEIRYKELTILSFLKEVAMETNDMEATIKNLLEKFASDVEATRGCQKKESLPKTKQVVSGILSRLELLLHVNSVPVDAQSALTRTMSHTQGFSDLMVKSDTDVCRPLQGFSRSMSAPICIDPDDTGLFKHIRRRHGDKGRHPSSILQDFVDDGEEDKPPHVIVIDQLFAFIGTDPEKAVSCIKFLKAAEERRKRGTIRKAALSHIKDLLAAASRVGGATHLVAAVASVLRHGPKVEDLLCGGMQNEVRDAFAEAMSCVVQLAAHHPLASASSIGLLCTIPYTRAEEKCLVRSHLVYLLDKLCSLGSHRADGLGGETQSPRQKVSALAWAGFQVLASRCVKWENEDGSHVEELEHSGLAKQVSTLLTNHLARATEGIGHAMAGTEALQEVLSLLNNLSRSKMGKAILSQPACVSKLLSLLLDQRPSPKLVLIILQLCRVSLPLMDCEDCKEVELPAWGQQLYSSHWSTAKPVSDPPAKIICLLLAKLGDFLVPGDQVLLSSRSPSQDASTPGRSAKPGDIDKPDDTDLQRGKLSVFVHKREDQMSHDIIQPLLSCDNRPFRLVGNTSMDKVMRLDREIAKNGKAELTTEDAVNAFKKAYKWAQMGLVISTAPPADGNSSENNNGSDKKKTLSELICKEKNSELARCDPVRAFISGHVANAMAAEVIALLQNLLSTQTNSPANNTWSQAVQRVLANALSGLPVLLGSLDGLSSPRSPRSQSNNQLMSLAKQANAALCAIGGFQETLKPGCQVKITGEGVRGTSGTVVSVSEQNDVVTIQLNSQLEDSPTYSDTIKVPLARVQPIRNEMFNRLQKEMTEAILSAVQAAILPADESTSPLTQPLHSAGDGNSMANQICRVVAEIRTRTAMVLAQGLQEIEFAKKFIEHCGLSIDMLKSLAKDCHAGSRLPLVEAHCQRLRMLYRDCAKPPPPPCRADIRPSKEMVWDVSRPFPPTRACLFSQGMTAVMFLGDPSAGVGLPRGTIIYANQPIPKEAPSFYWELEISSLGDLQEDSGAIVSFGFAPPAEKKDAAWTNPVGTCLFLNTGKAVHYNGASLLQWRSVRLDVTLSAGDVAGIGWERMGDATDSTQTPKGQVYFTYNGHRLSSSLDNVSGAMYPVVHIQKKNCRMKANFGARPFAYAEGQQHREAAEAANDVLRDIRESFGHLPFHTASDSESDSTEPAQASVLEATRDSKTPPRAPCKVAEPPATLKEYQVDASLSYKLLPSYDNFVVTGPDTMTVRPSEEDSEDEAVVDESVTEDHYALLVKAWEQKVFPVIRRRFRNEAERKDGLEQIRGALQLGMTDIARQTVEFLYEENGGIPRDLQLPTIEDIKEDLAKFTIDRVKKGTTVIIRTPTGISSYATTQLPKFAVRSMLKTFGLTGTVLDVDTANELVQVETYLRSEGVLVRFWYPLVLLEKPAQGMRKASITGGQTMDTSNIFIHRELLLSESSLSRMYLRTAFLRLTDHCNSPAMEVTSCSASLGSGMAACAATLQELDLENIQLLSEHLLSAPSTTGTLEATSPFQICQLSQLSLEPQVSLTSLVYRNSLRLKRELAVAIARASNQGEDYLIELTNQLCTSVQTAPEMFPCVSYPVNETKISTDVHFPGAACLLVSCIKTSEPGNKENPPYRAPWARISTYTGKRIKKCGQVTRQEVVSYPRDVHNQSSTHEQFAPAIIPGDLVYVKIGVSPAPGAIVTLHALPAQFLLAVAYMETLVTETFGCGSQACGAKTSSGQRELSGSTGSCGSSSSLNTSLCETNPSLWSLDNINITPSVFLHVLEFECGFLWKTELPGLVKEYMFHLLAQTLRILHYSEGSQGSRLTKLSTRLSPTQGMLNYLPRELKKLYDLEAKTMPAMSSVAGQGIGLGVTDTGRWSTYMHALMEACLAISEVIPCQLHQAKDVSENLQEEGAAGTSTLMLAAGSKKKKLKPKKDGLPASTRRSSIEQKGGAENWEVVEPSSVHVSQSLETTVTPAVVSSPPTKASSNSSICSLSATSSIKVDDMTWFPAVATTARILRYLVLKEAHCQEDMDEAIKASGQTLGSPTAHTRLLIITGIPTYLELATVKKAVSKVCNSYGGLDRDGLFVPTPQDVTHVHGVASLSAAEASDVHTELESKSESSLAQPSPAPQAPPAPELKKKSKLIEGYAVICLPSKTKVELVKKSFLKSRWLNLGEAGEVPDENLSVQTVSQALLTEPEANTALESFLLYKLSGKMGSHALGPAAIQALTEIFYGSYLLDQQQETICLCKEQILSPASLLAPFFNAVKPCKKPLLEAVTGILRQYGVIKSRDKDTSPVATEKSSKGKTSKKPVVKSQKEKQAISLEEKGNEEKSQSTDREKCSPAMEKCEKSPKDKEGATADVALKESKSLSKCEGRLLTLSGFLQYCEDLLKQDLRTLWKGLFASGLDLHLERCSCLDQTAASQLMSEWTLEKDAALVMYVNEVCSQLAISSARLHPHEVRLTEAHLTNEKYSCLQGLPVESVRLRFAFLQDLNNSLETCFLPLVDLRAANIYSRSTAYVLAQLRSIIFYDTKVSFINRILNASAKRKPDQAAPEITLNPIEAIGTGESNCQSSILCQSYCQLSAISSKKLCVRLASGGDPTYSFNVRMLGEEVHGTSGSFRHFLWQVARELQSPTLSLLLPCPSSAAGFNKGRLILKPGKMSYSEENLLIFVGQLLGITIRADIPLGLDLLYSVWKLLVGLTLDPSVDLQQADALTYKYMKKIEMAETEAELESVCGDGEARFVYTTLTGHDVELLPAGRSVYVNWHNRQTFLEAIKRLRLRELSSSHRVAAIITGLSSLLPYQVMTLMTPLDLEIRTSGRPHISLDFLKSHTMYQVGLVESDSHIEYFWTALESFSQEELTRFIKFACNQERVPHTCPCQEGGPDSAHVPPFPMKIAPPDGTGPPDGRYIRVETCMFIVKLPQYSSQEMMTQRLRYAINCREDPLSG
ncbi:probable E3 ubiquitin-protein ligase HECTD4 isoform X2 [Physella acuta]|uniref:probable E3 ubiquitin-protein ligase HECTD4 isoform X2 n=1 Tax=Physella acuta TaxID=109671 RepID=UPI0027DD8B75|nr:probable E3 ubiquitin-protein ligase HECTD4 isoform X2 [Physella acuta]